MALSQIELEMMDTYFKQIGMGHLWGNIKKLMASSCGFDQTELNNKLAEISNQISNLEQGSVGVDEATINDVLNLFK